MRKKKSFQILFVVLILLLFGGCKKNPKEEIHGFERWTQTRDAYMIFPDGTRVSQWKDETGQQMRFQLEDGTTLLQTSVLNNLEQGNEKKGLIDLPDMSLEARKKVVAYYEEQGTMFDVDERLKIAYQDYCTCMKEEERFTTHTVLQEIMPIAETERYVAFLSALTLPKQDHFTGDTVCLYDGRIFDREDGRQIDLKELFAADNWDEIQKELAVLCAADDTTVTEKDIKEAIGQADILVFQDYLEIWFPYGTWEKQEFDKGFGIKYDRLFDIMKDWAIPDKKENKEE